jgi:hypothetical protein
MEEDACRSKLFANDMTLYRQMQEKKITVSKAVEQAVETFVDCRSPAEFSQGP